MIKKGRKFLKYLLILTVILAITAAVGTAVFVHFYPKERVLHLIKEQSAKFLNRNVNISSIDYSFKGIILKGIDVYTIDGEEKNSIFTSDEAVIKFMPWALLKKEIKIWSLSVNRGSLNWEFSKDGDNLSNLAKEIRGRSKDMDPPSFKIVISKIVLKNFSLNISGITGQFSSLNGTYIIDSTVINRDFKKLRIADTVLQLPQRNGILSPVLDLDIEKNLKITGSAEVKSLSLDWVYKLRSSKRQLPFKWVVAKLKNIKADTDAVSCDVTASSTLRDFDKKISAAGHCTVTIGDRKTVNITSVNGTIGESTIGLEKLQIDADRGEINTISANGGTNVHISDLRGIVKSIPSKLKGILAGRFNYRKGIIEGEMKLSNINYVTNSIELFKIPAASVNIKNSELKVENIPVILFGKNRAVLSVATIDKDITKIYAVLNARHLDLNPVSKLAPVKDNIASNGKIDIPAHIFGKVFIEEAVYEKYRTYSTRIDYKIKGSSIDINNIKTTIFKGTVTGTGRISLESERPVVNAGFKFNNIRVNDIEFQDENMKDRFFGIANGRTNLKFTLGDNISESTVGNVTFDISRGKVVNTGIQKGLILFLADLKYKLRDLEFREIYGNIDVLGNQYMAKSFIFNSEDIRMSIKGKLDRNLMAENMNMKLEFNNHFIKDIPRPALSLLRKYSKGSWYEIPFAINGKITESKNIKLK